MNYQDVVDYIARECLDTNITDYLECFGDGKNIPPFPNYCNDIEDIKEYMEYTEMFDDITKRLKELQRDPAVFDKIKEFLDD